MKTCHRAISICGLIACWIAVQPCRAVTFTPLGFLDSQFGPSLAFGVSADGSTVVGESNSPQGLQAFRWRPGEGMIGLGDLPGGAFFSAAYACSGDGSIVVGASADASSGEEGTPFRWTEATGMQWLGSLGGPTSYGQAEAITPDGTVIVGASQAQSGIFAFRWTEMSGLVSLGDIPGGPALARAAGVSANGNVVTGTGSRVATFDQAFLWTPGTGMTALGSNNSAKAITPDGQFVAGTNFQGAYRWSAQTGFVQLGRLNGGPGLYFVGGMSADGSVIVGLADYNGTLGTGEAFIWDEVHGMRDLNVVLTQEFGLNLQGLFLFFAEAMSADGQVIAGYGFNQAEEQEAWVVDLGNHTSSVTSRIDVGSGLSLDGNQPNPFTGTTSIAFRLAQAAPVSLSVFDGSGRLVQTLFDREVLASGPHSVAWDGRGRNGHRVPAGLYFYRLQGARGSEARPMIVLK